jgi:hypothetical protein
MTFHTIEVMMAMLDRSASTPSHTTGLSMTPASISALLMSPKFVLNSQYHNRLDTPSPMTTGMNTTVRVNLRRGELDDRSSAST